MFKKSLSIILLGFALLICFSFGSGQPSMAAAPSPALITGYRLAAVTKISPNIALELDQFLTSIPAGYYTIASVEGLKNQLKTSQTLLVDVREKSEYQSGHD